LESEVEPLSDDDEAPNAIRLALHPDPDVRAAALAVVDDCRDLLRALTADVERAA
jgi:hypothetical protein